MVWDDNQPHTLKILECVFFEKKSFVFLETFSWKSENGHFQNVQNEKSQKSFSIKICKFLILKITKIRMYYFCIRIIFNKLLSIFIIYMKKKSRRNYRKSRRSYKESNGGMFNSARTAASTVAQKAALEILQRRGVKVLSNGIENPENLKDPSILLTGRKKATLKNSFNTNLIKSTVETRPKTKKHIIRR